MRAFILAGGLGTRLQSIVSDRPKPLAEIGGKPFLEHQLVILKEHQIREFVLCVGYLHEQIIEHFGDGSRWDVEIEYSIEEHPLGTGGAVKHAERFVDGTFLVFNGDTHFKCDLSRLIQSHQRLVNETKCLATIALTKVGNPSRYGTVELDDDGMIVDFTEKSGNPVSQYISAGVYAMEPSLLQRIPTEKKVSLELDTFPKFVSEERSLAGCLLEGFFIDIGTPEDFVRFQNYNGN